MEEGDQLQGRAVVQGRDEGSQGERSAGREKTNLQYIWQESATELGDVLMHGLREEGVQDNFHFSGLSACWMLVLWRMGRDAEVQLRNC